MLDSFRVEFRDDALQITRPAFTETDRIPAGSARVCHRRGTESADHVLSVFHRMRNVPL
jgi:hypothetical protein